MDSAYWFEIPTVSTFYGPFPFSLKWVRILLGPPYWSPGNPQGSVSRASGLFPDLSVPLVQCQ